MQETELIKVMDKFIPKLKRLKEIKKIKNKLVLSLCDLFWYEKLTSDERELWLEDSSCFLSIYYSSSYSSNVYINFNIIDHSFYNIMDESGLKILLSKSKNYYGKSTIPSPVQTILNDLEAVRVSEFGNLSWPDYFTNKSICLREIEEKGYNYVSVIKDVDVAIPYNFQNFCSRLGSNLKWNEHKTKLVGNNLTEEDKKMVNSSYFKNYGKVLAEYGKALEEFITDLGKLYASLLIMNRRDVVKLYPVFLS